MITTPPQTPPDYDGVLKNLTTEEGARLVIDDIVCTLGQTDESWVLDSASSLLLRFDILESWPGHARIAFSAGTAAGELRLDVDPSGWVRAEALLGEMSVFLGFIEKVWEQYDIWPAGGAITQPRDAEAPGRIGKRRNWLNLDSRLWPTLAPIANPHGWVQIELEDL